MQHVGSYFPDQGLNLHPLQWKLGVLITGQPGMSLHTQILMLCFYFHLVQDTFLSVL